MREDTQLACYTSLFAITLMIIVWVAPPPERKPNEPHQRDYYREDTKNLETPSIEIDERTEPKPRPNSEDGKSYYVNHLRTNTSYVTGIT